MMPFQDLWQSPAPKTLSRREKLSVPLDIILSWPAPNYVDPDTRGPALYIVNGLAFAITLVCVILRLYTRIWIRKYFGLDDLFICVAMVGAIGVTACVMLAFHDYDWDRHVYDMRPYNFSPAGKILYAAKILWSLTSNAVRASVICLYYRLLDHVGMNKWRWVLHLNTFFVVGVFLEQQLTAILTCLPVKSLWTWPPIQDAKCIDYAMVMIVGSILNTISEFIVACLPIPIILMLKVNPEQRKAIFLILCGGFLVVICGCVRCYYVWLSTATFDASWWALPHWISSEVEIDVAIICACAPALRPVLGRIFSRGWSAANTTYMKDPSQPSHNWRARRARSLFSKKPSPPSSIGYATNTTQSLDAGQTRFLKKDVDLEGIGNDGFGYSVTIITGHGTKVRKRWDARNREWHFYPEEPDDTEDGSEPRHSRSKSFTRSSTNIARKKSGEMDIHISEKTAAGPSQNEKVLTKEVPKIKKSFYTEFSDETDHADGGGEWDPSNLYPQKPSPRHYEEDIEIGFQMSEAPVSDWSLINGESPARAERSTPIQQDRRSHRASSSPAGPQPVHRIARPETAHAALTTALPGSRSHSRQSSVERDRVRPSTSWDSGAMNYRVIQGPGDFQGDVLRAGILPSPSTVRAPTIEREPERERERKRERETPKEPTSRAPRQRVKNTSRELRRHTPSPPPLPPVGRLPRTVSPAVQPLNSSQAWMQLHRSRSPPNFSPSTSPASAQTPRSEGPVTQVTNIDATVAELWANSQLASPSLGSGEAQGSEESLVDKAVKHRQDDEESDDGFNLPLQRHSPRNSGLNDPRRRASQDRRLPNISVRDYG